MLLGYAQQARWINSMPWGLFRSRVSGLIINELWDFSRPNPQFSRDPSCPILDHEFPPLPGTPARTFVAHRVFNSFCP